MKRNRLASGGFTLMVCLVMMILQSAFAELPVSTAPINKTLDVFLHDEGLLVGQAVSPQGTAKEGIPVILLNREQELARTKTDKLGRFAVKGLKGGTYQIATARSLVPLRAWTKATAPPTAAVGALLVEGMTVREEVPTLADASLGDTTTSPNTTTHHVGKQDAEPAGSNVTYGGESVMHSTGTYSTGAPAHHARGCPCACHAAGAGCRHRFLGLSPLMIGAAVAAAVAIPLALDDDDSS